MKIIYYTLGIIVLVFFVFLAINNMNSVTFYYLPSQFIELPMIVLLFIVLLLGQVIGVLSMFRRLLQLRAQANKYRRESLSYQKKLEEMQKQIVGTSQQQFVESHDKPSSGNPSSIQAS